MTSTYSSQIEGFTCSLLTRIRANSNNPIVINKLSLHYSYDVATHLAFGNAGGFISGNQNEEARSVMAAIKKASVAFGLFYHVPWIMTLLTTFDFLPGPLKGWNDWSEKLLKERIKVG